MRTIKLNQYWILIFILILFSSCKAPEAYRKALDAFSLGAGLEMTDRFPEKDLQTRAELPGDFMFFDDLYASNTTIDPEKTFTQYYKEALKQADIALKGAKQLEKQNILDNAYAIKALILWRQGKYEEADSLGLTTEPMLVDNPSGQENDVRDLAMMQALPGLINIEKAYLALEQSGELASNFGALSTQAVAQRQPVYEEIKGLYEQFAGDSSDGAPSIARGLALIERAIDHVDNNSAIVLYLRNAQLAAMDTWGDMLLNVFTASKRLSVSEFAPNEAAWINAERKKYEQQLNDYFSALAQLLEGGEDNKLFKYWKRML